MASKQKARQFLETSETYSLYLSIIEYTLAYFIAKAEKENSRQFANDLKRAREEYKKDFEKAIEITEEVYCEIFSDEELDDLIVIHSTPAIKKLRGLAPEIMNKTLKKYSLL